MKSLLIAFLAAISTINAAHGQGGSSQSSAATVPQAQPNVAVTATTHHDDKQTDSKVEIYEFPTAEEMAPMRPEYLAVLAKIHEPPEMAGKAMQVRKAVSPKALKLGGVMGIVGAPEKATHEQRTTAIRELLEFANSKQRDDGFDGAAIYSTVAVMACVDGVEPQAVIGYASNAIVDPESDDDYALALRARMYLKSGDRNKALDDLEKIMADSDGHALGDGSVDPRKESVPCGWSIADFDALGDDPRASAAKGLYLTSFIGYNAEARGTVKESDIRDLYARAARSWHSPIPHILELTLYVFGSERSMAGVRCTRANVIGSDLPEIISACAKYDEDTRRAIRELTMALVIEPTSAMALSGRAEKYLQLAQASYADGKPSRQLFELAINDFTAAIAAGGKNRHDLYCDRALALASIGMYKEAAIGYAQGMKLAKSGIEDSPSIYEQLAGLYMKLGNFNEAANLMTQAIMNVSGGGMDMVIFGGGINAFRTLYPEYELVPDEILAEAVRRRYNPLSKQSWDGDFISKGGWFQGKIASTVLPELYVMRGDAYAKAGRRVEAMADYGRVKSDVWSGGEPLLPRHLYFNERGNRNHDAPEPWPPPPPKS